tara:strand:- start:1270 stop:2004 length:735 start_codon:yes stop_codon:yes gene_type:complete
MPNYHDIKNNPDSAYKQRSLFGRRQGRAIRDERGDALRNVLPQVEIAQKHLNQEHTTPPAELFDESFQSHWLEIGFGHGERLAQLMKNQSETAFIGAEPFINGMAGFLKELQQNDQPLDNIRVLMDDGMFIARSLTPASLDGIYVLNPDPWHKKRHHKRRIINQTTLDTFAKILKPGGKLVMSTDVPPLSEWMCTHANHHPAFRWAANTSDDWSIAPPDWIQTKYEIKGAKGAKKMVYLFFERV